MAESLYGLYSTSDIQFRDAANVNNQSIYSIGGGSSGIQLGIFSKREFPNYMKTDNNNCWCSA